MTGVAIVRSTLIGSLTRYSRSVGLWLLLLSGPVGARFMIARDDGSGIQIALGKHLPIMTSAMLGISLGIVVATLLLPIAFLYLRSNTTRRQPWQVEEVTPASRIAIALGRFGADVAVLFGMLTTLTLAGWLLGWLIVSGPLNVWQISWCLWLVAAPPLMGLAALRILFDALPVTRGAIGDTLFFILWLASIAVPAAVSDRPSSFTANMYDFAGFVRPLVGEQPSAGRDFSIGSTDGILPGRTPLDVLAGVHSSGYILSRLAWAAIAIAVATLAGLLYRPHTAPKRRQRTGFVAHLLEGGPPPQADVQTAPAGLARSPYFGLVLAEVKLIGVGRTFRVLAILATLAGLFGDYRHIGSPAALLLLIFGMVAHAGSTEAGGLIALTRTALVPPLVRRAGFVVAVLGWAAAMAMPAAIVRLSPQPLILALGTAGTAALVAIILASASRSSFAPRLVLIILWYGYLSS